MCIRWSLCVVGEICPIRIEKGGELLNAKSGVERSVVGSLICLFLGKLLWGWGIVGSRWAWLV